MDPYLRYARQLALPGFSAAHLERLRAASVLVVGAGGLGSPVIAYLAAAGVGRLRVADPDVVDVTNLQRQVLYTTADIDLPKAELAAHRASAINPDVTCEPVTTSLTSRNVHDLMDGMTVMADCTDNFRARYLINDACISLGLPDVWAAVDQFAGRCSVVLPRQSACLRCVFGPPEALPAEPRLAAVGGTGACSVRGAFGPICGLAGSLQAGEIVKVLTGLGQPLAGAMATIDALTCRFATIPLAQDPACPACHGSSG